MIATIAALGPESRRVEEDALTSLFPLLPGYEAAENVLLYVTAFPEEIETSPFLSSSLSAKKRIFCPRVDRAARQLRLHRVRDPAADLAPGVLGIREPRADLPEIQPEELDWILAPGLAFDRRGYRLGRGAGYYDRLLTRLRPDAICWALCLSCQLVERLPVEDHDMPLDGVSTPDRVIQGARSSSRTIPPEGRSGSVG